MANSWFRMYHEFATDPKVQMLSEADQRRFIMILCLRCCNDDVTLHSNNPMLHDDEIAFQLRIPMEDFQRTKRTLIERGLIDENCNPCNWDKRQFVSDTSNDRVKRFREKKKRYSNVTCNANETKSNALDTDTESDTETDVKKHIVEQARPADSPKQPTQEFYAVGEETEKPKPLDPILEIFEHWKIRMGHPRAVLDDKRKKFARAALKLGYTANELCEAITGCSKTPHNMGTDPNGNGQRYDDFHIIFGSASQIDRFIRNARSPPMQQATAVPASGDKVRQIAIQNAMAWSQKKQEAMKNETKRNS